MAEIFIMPYITIHKTLECINKFYQEANFDKFTQICHAHKWYGTLLWKLESVRDFVRT